jgi:transcriptional regulator with XRE-family HTH domain
LSGNTPDPKDVDLGARIRSRRRALHLTQEKLAERCGVTFQQIQKYEQGTNRIYFSRAVQIADALDCSLIDLMETSHNGASKILETPRATNCDLAAGAGELLEMYEQMSTRSRSALLTLVRELSTH